MCSTFRLAQFVHNPLRCLEAETEDFVMTRKLNFSLFLFRVCVCVQQVPPLLELKTEQAASRERERDRLHPAVPPHATTKLVSKLG